MIYPHHPDHRDPEMSSDAQQTELLYSSLAADPDLGPIVELFVLEMPAKIRVLVEMLDRDDWAQLRILAHQLKGAAGSYGFWPISSAAARLEDTVRRSRPTEEIAGAVDQLVDLCNRATTGVRTA